MKVALSTHGRFHSFDLARQLEARDMLAGIWTSYPASKVSNERLPPEKVHAVSAWMYVRQALNRIPRVPQGVVTEVEWLKGERLDRTVARSMPRETDAVVALSGGGLACGRAVQARGGVYACDRGSTHIAFQQDAMREEYARYGWPFEEFSPRMMAKEETEYAEADLILTPTAYTARTFVQHGLPEGKVKRAPYGVDLTQFYPDGKPPEDTFEVLFVGALSIRKGVKYLLEAFEQFDHPMKRLTLVGAPMPETADLLAKAVGDGKVSAVGIVSRDGVREHMSRSHVMVLPSIEEGLALVQAQALACGLPVIATPPTGCEDLYEDGKEGFIVPLRDPGAIAGRLMRLADEPELRLRMSQAAVERVRALGGWDRYGETVVGHLQAALAAKR